MLVKKFILRQKMPILNTTTLKKANNYSYFLDFTEKFIKTWMHCGYTHQFVLLAAIDKDDCNNLALEAAVIHCFGLADERMMNSWSPYHLTKQWALPGKSVSIFMQSIKAWGSVSRSSSFSSSGEYQSIC